MSEDTSAVEPPVTGNTTIDQALAGLDGLDELPVAEHHARLSAVQDVLGGVLDSSRNAPAHTVPEGLRPKGQPRG